MHDFVDPAQRARDGVAVPDVAAEELDLIKHRIECGTRGVNLFDETVDDSNDLAFPEQQSGEMRTDEPGATGNKDTFGH